MLFSHVWKHVSLSCVWLFVTTWTTAHQASLTFPDLSPRVCSNSCPWSWWCHPTNSSCYPLLLLPSVLPSIRVFSSESAHCIRWPKYWSFRISPTSKYSGLISFRINWFDLFAVQGTPRSLLQHHSSKASILQCSVFFTVLLLHPYMTRKNQSFDHTDFD